MTHPWMQFYTRDWLDNKELRRCSMAARGLLIDLMCLAHEGVPYGYLADKLGPLTTLYMASRAICHVDEFTAAVSELESFHRLQRTPEGGVICPKDGRGRREATGSKTERVKEQG